jgi:hypothetical protein
VGEEHAALPGWAGRCLCPTWRWSRPTEPGLWGGDDDHDVRSPTELSLRPGRSMGAQDERPAAVVAAVRSRAPRRSSCCARALRRIFRPQYLAGRFLFSGVCGAVDPVRHRLSHGVAYLREDAPGPARFSVCRELDRPCGRLYRGLLRARGMVTPAGTPRGSRSG